MRVPRIGHLYIVPEALQQMMSDDGIQPCVGRDGLDTIVMLEPIEFERQFLELEIRTHSTHLLLDVVAELLLSIVRPQSSGRDVLPEADQRVRFLLPGFHLETKYSKSFENSS